MAGADTALEEGLATMSLLARALDGVGLVTERSVCKVAGAEDNEDARA